jgi:hypothetical protein
MLLVIMLCQVSERSGSAPWNKRALLESLLITLSLLETARNVVPPPTIPPFAQPPPLNPMENIRYWPREMTWSPKRRLHTSQARKESKWLSARSKTVWSADPLSHARPTEMKYADINTVMTSLLASWRGDEQTWWYEAKNVASTTKLHLSVSKTSKIVFSQQIKCFWNRYNAAWPYRGEPSSDHAVPTAASRLHCHYCE